MKKIYGQAILDYAVLLMIVIAALMIMVYYVRNTVSGKMREGADSIGQGEVYSPSESTKIKDSVENR